PDGSVYLIPVDIDIREVVVGADFLNLTQRILQRAPVPETDVLQRLLIVLRVHRGDARLGWKRNLLDAVERERLPCHLDVVGDIGTLPNQSVRLDHETVHVPADDRHADVDDDRWND